MDHRPSWRAAPGVVVAIAAAYPAAQTDPAFDVVSIRRNQDAETQRGSAPAGVIIAPARVAILPGGRHGTLRPERPGDRRLWRCASRTAAAARGRHAVDDARRPLSAQSANGDAGAADLRAGDHASRQGARRTPRAVEGRLLRDLRDQPAADTAALPVPRRAAGFGRSRAGAIGLSPARRRTARAAQSETRTPRADRSRCSSSNVPSARRRTEAPVAFGGGLSDDGA